MHYLLQQLLHYVVAAAAEGCHHSVCHKHANSARIPEGFPYWAGLAIFLNTLNSLRPRQNGRRFEDDTFKRFFQNENVSISIKISLKFVPNAPIINIQSLVQIMAWRRADDKLLSEPMMVRLLTHICVTRPKWVIIISKSLKITRTKEKEIL